MLWQLNFIHTFYMMQNYKYWEFHKNTKGIKFEIKNFLEEENIFLFMYRRYSKIMCITFINI